MRWNCKLYLIYQLMDHPYSPRVTLTHCNFLCHSQTQVSKLPIKVLYLSIYTYRYSCRGEDHDPFPPLPLSSHDTKINKQIPNVREEKKLIQVAITIHRSILTLLTGNQCFSKQVLGYFSFRVEHILV